MNLALIYLARSPDSNLTSIKDFFHAYNSFPPGCDHELVVIIKGRNDLGIFSEIKNLARSYNARILELSDDGWDWGAYMRAASQLKHDWLCFLNTYSRPQVSNWLDHYRKAEQVYGKDLGAVGATASYESMIPLQIAPSFADFPHRILNPVKWAILKIFFPAYPNPHLRSNAFMVRREVFQKFAVQHRIPQMKLQAWQLESGKRGFTNFLRQQGLKTVVAGVDDKFYEPEQWPQSGTFRVPGQPNLLVADNQTTWYDQARPEEKKRLEKNTWGTVFSC